MTADVAAGNDVWAVAWDDMDLDVAAGHDIPLVWTFGDLTGTIDAANRIGDDDPRFGRIKSYGSIDATIIAGHLPVGDPKRDAFYGQIDLVEAWDDIDGTITAATSIGTVRSGA
ncbi:hypothetical protein LCGC14_2749640, partial [marine sediment metagenome]